MYSVPRALSHLVSPEQGLLDPLGAVPAPTPSTQDFLLPPRQEARAEEEEGSAGTAGTGVLSCKVPALLLPTAHTHPYLRLLPLIPYPLEKKSSKTPSPPEIAFNMEVHITPDFSLMRACFLKHQANT